MNLFTTPLLRTLGLIFVFALSTTVLSQDKPRDWTLYGTVDGVKILYKYADCISNSGTDQERVILKFENTNSYPISVTWKTDVYYNGKCHNCGSDDPEFVSSQKVLKESSVEGNCEDRSSRLSFYSDFLDYQAKQKLTKFELNDIKVEKLKSTK